MVDNITLTDLTSLTNETTAISQINNNSATIVSMSDNVLWTSGGSGVGQTMQVDIDMNSNRILNLPTPSSLTEPLRVQDGATLTAGGTINVSALPGGGITGQVLTSIGGFNGTWTSVTGTGNVVNATSPTITSPTLTSPTISSPTISSPVISGTVSGATTTGTGNIVLSTSPVLTTPNLGTPSAIQLTNATQVPMGNGVTGSLPVANGGTGRTIAQPYFYGYLASAQSVTTNTATKIQFTALFDNQSWFSGASNYRYIPLLAGKYLVTVDVWGNSSGTTTLVQAYTYKNGSVYSQNASSQGASSAVSLTTTTVVSCNGSTDYIEGWGLVQSSSSPVLYTSSPPPYTTSMSINYLGP